MYCKACGKQIDDDSAFCKMCGAPQHGSAGGGAVRPTGDRRFAARSVIDGDQGWGTRTKLGNCKIAVSRNWIQIFPTTSQRNFL